MYHLEKVINDWPLALENFPDWCLLKAFSGSVLRTAKLRWVELGRDPRRLVTCLRFYTDPDPRYFFSLDLEACRQVWRTAYPSYLDGTFFDQYAPYVDLLETLNEHYDEGMSQATLGLHLTAEQAAIDVFDTVYRPRLPNLRLVIGNSPPGNSVPRMFMELAIQTGHVLGTHPYSHYVNGEHDPGDWEFHSGRWHFDEQREGLKPNWAFTECGPYFDAGNGWKSPLVVNGELEKYKAGMRWWFDKLVTTPAYLEGRIAGGPGALFTSGGTFGTYETTTQEMLPLADQARAAWHHPGWTPPQPKKPVDTRARGLDVSWPQDPQKMRFAEWKQQGLVFCFYGAALGTVATRWASEHQRAIRAAGLLCGPYQEFKNENPLAQCDFFVSQRRPDDNFANMLVLGDYAGQTEPPLRVWCDRYDEKRLPFELWLYTNRPWWLENVVNQGKQARYSKYGLVLAGYPNDTFGVDNEGHAKPVPVDAASILLRSTPPFPDPIKVPLPWVEYDSHQYTGQGSLPATPQGYRFLDLQVYKGTEAQLRARFPEAPMTVEKALEHIHAAEIELTLAREELRPKWWELWPEGPIEPARKLAIPNKVMTFVHDTGLAFSPQPLTRPVAWSMVVNERKGHLLKVFDQAGTINDWWVRAEEVSPA